MADSSTQTADAAGASAASSAPAMPSSGLRCINCSRPATAGLSCPVCKKLGNNNAVFCGPACYKSKYPQHHRKFHVKADASKKYEGPEGTYDPHIAVKKFKYTGPLRAVYPNEEVPKREMPDHIPKPDYGKEVNGVSFSEECAKKAMETHGKVLTADEQEGMRKVCKLAREVLDIAAAALRPGITTLEIDKIVHDECVKRDAYPSPLNYHKFPRSVCTSINEVICHGIPDARPLEDGDIINLDVTLFHGGLHGDLNATYPVGSSVSQENLDLIACSRECLDEAIRVCKPGFEFRDVGEIIEKIAAKRGFSTNKTYVGHGINQLFHCAPNVPHYAGNRASGRMQVGQTFTIEPMICIGQQKEVHWPDNWTAATTDGKCSAQFEETLLITADGVEVLTAAPGWALPEKRPLEDATDGTEDATAPGGGEGASKKKKKKKKAKKAAGEQASEQVGEQASEQADGV
ncbi:hypothetical protein JCM10207_001363 [Rhodosporidiobolus poonsookiae]